MFTIADPLCVCYAERYYLVAPNFIHRKKRGEGRAWEKNSTCADLLGSYRQQRGGGVKDAVAQIEIPAVALKISCGSLQQPLHLRRL